MVLTGTLDNQTNGTIILDGNQTVTIATLDPDGAPNSGTFRFVGDGDGTAGENITIPDFGANDYYNVEIASTVNPDNFVVAAGQNLTIRGNLSITSGGLNPTTNSNDLSVLGSVSIVGANASLNAADTDFNIDGNLTLNTNGTFAAPNNTHTFTLAGNFTHSGDATFTHNSGTLTLDGGNQSILGDENTAFCSFNKTLPAATTATLTFTTASTQSFASGCTLTLKGTEDYLLSLTSDNPGALPANQAAISLLAGGLQAIEYVSVANSNASGGMTLVARYSDEGTNYQNWLFGSATMTWQGDLSDDWDTPGNWDLGMVPYVPDTAIVPNVGANDYPVLATNVEIENLTIDQANAGGVTVTLDGKSLDINDTLSSNGTIILIGSENVTIENTDTGSGTFRYIGDGDAGVDNFIIQNISASSIDYYDLVINNASGLDNFTFEGNINVNGALTVTNGNVITSTFSLTQAGVLTVTNGSFNASAGNVDANGNIVLNGGTFTAPASGQTFTVAGNFDSSGGGTFQDNDGEITFDTTAESIISGNNTFHDFTCVIPSKILTFESLSTQIIENDLDVKGTTGTLITLRSDDSGNQRWNLQTNTASQSVQFLNVNDGEVLVNDVVCFSCTDGVNNDDGEAQPHWVFRTLAISAPGDGEVVDTTPTIIGSADPGDHITFFDEDDNQVAEVDADANGNFRVEVSEGDAYAEGANVITPKIGLLEGGSIIINVQLNPAYQDVPVITSHEDGDVVIGSTPTIEGYGAPGAAFTILANDEEGNLLLADVGNGNVGADLGSGYGEFSITLTTALPRGTNYISVTIGNVASHIVTVKLTAPYGIVFDSITDNPIEGAEVSIYRASDDQLAVPGVDLDASDTNPYTTLADGFYSFVCDDGDYYIRINAAGYNYPSSVSDFSQAGCNTIDGRSICVPGSDGEDFTIGVSVLNIDHPVDGTGNIIRIIKTANKKEARIGEVVTYTVLMESKARATIIDVFLKDLIPPGFKYIENRVTLDGVPIADPSSSRPIVFDIGDFTAGQTKTLKYQLIIGSGVTPGEYENKAYAQYADGTYLSNVSRATVKIVLDPLFDMGTLIGKVFFDKNENGIQDKPEYIYEDGEMYKEEPIGNVSIVMEDGTIVRTDSNGQFHIPSIIPGRHLLRLDERTLPEGSYLTTDKVVVVNVTPGMMLKVNFGVNIEGEIEPNQDADFFNRKVNISQNKDRPKPRLNTSLYGETIALYNDAFARKAEFRNFTNYATFIKKWKLDILDKPRKKVIKRFEGDGLNIFDPIYWDGKDTQGKLIDTSWQYEYRLTVEDGAGRSDETKAKDINFTKIDTEEALKEYLEVTEEEKQNYIKWADDNDIVNNVNVQNINVQGETIYIDKLTTKIQGITVMKDGKMFADVPIVEKKALTAKDLLENRELVSYPTKSRLEIILPNGDYDILVQEDLGKSAQAKEDVASVVDGQAQVDEINGNQLSTYSKKVSVGEDYLFFVGMGDAEVGYKINTGNIEPVEQDKKFKEGFYVDGKLAYYLKGKIKGKYLVTSSFDSERQQKDIFKYIDEDEYYPVYGDNSELNYSATDTQGKLYLLVEWDKSSALWGNYSVGFDDTEFGKYSRSLFGAKLDFESLSRTKYGEAVSKAVLFRAQAQQKAAHVEYLATGGSLYYLKHKDIIAGSDKVKVQVRDGITGLVLSEKEMLEGSDYELDYESGRMIFWLPVPMIAQSYSIVSDDLLDGNLVYVVADYEYDVTDEVDEANMGLRVKQALTDSILVGGTLVKEKQSNVDYGLRATDLTIHLGEDAKVVAEYAESDSEAMSVFASTDGGLTFAELGINNDAKGKAYGISYDAKLFNRVAFHSYYKYIDSNFSTTSTTSQQGKELTGFEAIYDISEKTKLIARHDIQSLIDDGNLQTQVQLGAVKTSTSLMQVMHDLKKLKLTAEYQKKEVTERLSEFDSSVATETDTIALKADYALNDKVTLSVEQQKVLQGEGTDQTTLGVTAKPTDKVTLSAKEVIAEDGTSTSMDVAADMNEKFRLTGGYTVAVDREGNKTASSSLDSGSNIGMEYKVDENTTMRTALGLSGSIDGSHTTSATLGGTQKIDVDTDLDTEFVLSDSSADGEIRAYTFGTKKKIAEDLQMATSQTFQTQADSYTSGNKYSLIREKEGKKLEGSLTKAYTEGKDEVSNTNIFGLSGDVNDKWAVTGSYEKGDVQNLNGTQTTRDALSVAAAYVDKNEETGRSLKSSTKMEVRLDKGDQDKRQYLVSNATEGKVNDELTVFGKAELSKTRNLTTDINEAEHMEMMVGGAYRPVYNDKLNLISRYTYLESKGPDSQEDTASVEEERAHVMAMDAIYDINDRWQFVEKFAYRIAEEKVEGFDFNKTHTWLMVHRLNYKFGKDWTVGGEYRTLTQREAQDQKKGFLVEAARNLGEYMQLGVGYNFTQFDDDLTSLDYTSQGPFLRMTGKLYDRTDKEKERARKKWLEEKIFNWAWIMVREELAKENSPIIEELNYYFILAEKAKESGDFEESKKIYRDIIMAGDMMLQEASEHIRKRIEKEEKLKEMKIMADQYYKNGQYEKAKKILEKIMEEAK